MRKPCKLRVKCYNGLLNDINKYLSALPESKASDNIGEMYLNEIILNSMKNGWSKQAYVQVFDCETITFKNYANMFELMEIARTVYEGVVYTSYKKY